MKSQTWVAHGGVPSRILPGTRLELPRRTLPPLPCLSSPVVTTGNVPPETCMDVQAYLLGPINLVAWDSRDQFMCGGVTSR